jgi:hypothetical protein
MNSFRVPFGASTQALEPVSEATIILIAPLKS